jgi:hypothetical protein
LGESFWEKNDIGESFLEKMEIDESIFKIKMWKIIPTEKFSL